MQLIVESPHLEVNDKLMELVQAKMHNLEKICHRITRCVVVLKKDKNDRDRTFRIETRLAVPKKTLFVSEHADNFEMALHKSVDGLIRQLHRYKGEREEIW